MNARYGRERGVILITTVIVMFTLAAFGSAFMLTSVSASRYTVQQSHLSRASAIARAGVDEALYQVDYEARTFDPPPPFEPPWRDFGGGQLRTWFIQQTDADGDPVPGLALIRSEGMIERQNSPDLVRTVEVTVYLESWQIHNLYYKAIYAGNTSGSPYGLEFTGVNHQRSARNQTDHVDGDIHIEGDINLGSDASAHRFGDLDATGNLNKLDDLGEFDHHLGGDPADHLQAPDLRQQGYERADRKYVSWLAPEDQPGVDRNVVHVKDEYAYYDNLGMLERLAISREGGYYSPGGYYEWNSQCDALPQESLANFFHQDYQNHYADSFGPADDAKIDATTNYYVGQANGGTESTYGDRHGLYGGGHSVVTITEEMNNKVYLADGNVWFDSDGDNHLFFVPGPGVDRVNITILAKGNIYIGDQIFVTTNDVNDQQFDRNIGGSTSAEAYSLTDPESGIALIAMADGESYNDINKNGKYDVGETIIGRDDPNTPRPAANNSAAGDYPTDYAGRMEGSGNIVFGDTISGPVGVVEAFMFAENNFADITADTSQGDQNPYIFGNMTAGNHVLLNRNTDAGWLDIKPMNNFSPPPGWVEIDGAWYPAGTTPQNVDNPFVTYHMVYPGKWESTIDAYGNVTYNKKSDNGWTVMQRTHNPLLLTYDERLEAGVIDLPGLPSAVDTETGAWKVIVWREF